MNMHWTATAAAQLDALYAYIAHDSETYALRMVDRITRRSQKIGVFPLSGRRVPEYDSDHIREVFCGPYRIIYSLRPDQIDTLAVVHGAMNIYTRSQALLGNAVAKLRFA